MAEMMMERKKSRTSVGGAAEAERRKRVGQKLKGIFRSDRTEEAWTTIG
jgi:hypothetical protein